VKNPPAEFQPVRLPGSHYKIEPKRSEVKPTKQKLVEGDVVQKQYRK
jgi:hypothetical protein